MKTRLHAKALALVLVVCMMGMMAPRVNGQTTADQISVIELSLHMAEMNPNDHQNNTNTPVLVIVDNGVLPQGLTLTWFGNPVVLKSAQQIATEGISAYVLFDGVYLTANDASVGFSYIKQGGASVSHFLAKCQKNGTVWVNTINQ